MSTIVTRVGKGSPLTNAELDSNFNNLNDDKLESGDNVSELTNDAGYLVNGVSAEFSSLEIASGIYFGVSDPANYLDDYETGTWTPVFGSTSGSFESVVMDEGFSNNSYVKIGKFVFVHGYCRSDSISLGDAGGALTITGLPFVAQSPTSSGRSIGSCVGYNFGSAIAPDTCYIRNSTSYIQLLSRASIDNTNESHNITAAQSVNTGSDANIITFSIAYTVA